MRLRLYHHRDGARVAYRELGAGPPLALLHSALLSHMEWEPVVAELADRFRVVLPDLPLHGDSETRIAHPYTLDWFAEVLGGFAAEVLGPRPLLAGHDAGAEILLHAVLRGRVAPARLVLMANRLHAAPQHPLLRGAWRTATCAAAIPGLDWLLSYGAGAVFTPERAHLLSARANPAAGDLVRHAFADVPGNASLARAWPSAPARGRAGRSPSCSSCTPAWTCPCCCCGPIGTRCIRWRWPRRCCRCSPTGSCGSCRAPASWPPTTTPSASRGSLPRSAGRVQA